MIDSNNPAPIWRNGITNTIAIVDMVRKKNNFKNYDFELDDVMGKWFRFSRSVSVSDYRSAEEMFDAFCAQNNLGRSYKKVDPWRVL